MTYRKLVNMVSDTRLGALRCSIGAAMCMTMAAMFLLAAPMAAWANTPYVNADGVGQTSPVTATAIGTGSTALSTGWYIVNGSVTVANRIVVTGDVNLILANNATLTASQGIQVAEGNTLNIWAQNGNQRNGAPSGAGSLTATGGVIEPTSDATGGSHAAIGGNVGQNAGTIIINGGNITATSTTRRVGTGTALNQSHTSGAGIGGGSGTGAGVNLKGGDGGTIRINGGTVNATSGGVASGISNPDQVRSGAGIGGGGGPGVLAAPSSGGHGVIIEITGGRVTATSGTFSGTTATASRVSIGAGIGGGAGRTPGNSGNITISGGTVIATAGTGHYTGGSGTSIFNAPRGFDIGGGGGLTVGTSNVTISGNAEVELRGNGFGGTPNFSNAAGAVISGSAAGTHAGVHGKNLINVTGVTASPASQQAFGEPVTLTAQFHVTRRAGLTNPVPSTGSGVRFSMGATEISGTVTQMTGSPVGNDHTYTATISWTPTVANIGNHTITARWVVNGTDSRYAAGATGTLAGGFTVNKRTLTSSNLTVTNTTRTFNGNPQGATVDFSGGINATQAGAITVNYQGSGGTTYPKSTTAPTNAGTYDVLVSTAGGNEYDPMAETNVGPLTISKATLANPYHTYERNVHFNATEQQIVNLSSTVATYRIAADNLTFTPGSTTGDVAIINTRAAADNGITFIIAGNLTSADANKAATIPVVISGFTNYTDITINVVVTIVDGPPAPTNITAVAGDRQATVSFDLSSGAASYTVTSHPEGHTATGPTSPIIVPGLTNNVEYFFTVTAKNAAGQVGATSDPSNPVTPFFNSPATGLPNLTVATMWLYILIAASLSLWGYVGYTYIPRRKSKRG